ncbi:MAG: CsgG/HfaB family protein [Burkholderiaceae bacterium]
MPIINTHFVGRVPRKALTALLASSAIVLAGCASKAGPPTQVEAPQSDAAQRQAQQSVVNAPPAKPVLKRKIALGRITNETRYGQSLLRTDTGDPLGKQVTDMLSKALTESGAYLVFERPDIAALENESDLTGQKLDLIGVDALVIGSLTEFGRKTVGKSGFVSSTKKQVAFAKVDLRLVDAKTGLAFHSVSGAGEASIEAGSTFGFGSRAGYDGTLNDAAIRQAVSEGVNGLANGLKDRPWETSILSVEGQQVFVSGGKSQGIKPGMVFSVQTEGKRVKSRQTGFTVQLPGKEVAQLKIDSLFGSSDADEGSVGTIVSGSIAGQKPEKLVIRAMGDV